MANAITELLRPGQKVDPFGRGEDAGQRELAKKLNEEAVAHWFDPAWRAEQAALVSVALDNAFVHGSLIPSYFETRAVGEFDTVEIKKTKGVRAFWTHLGGYIEESNPEDERIVVPRDFVGYHVSELEDKIRADYALFMQSLVRKGRVAMENEVNRHLLNTMAAATPVGSAQHIDATGTGLTAQVLNRAISAVKDAPRDNIEEDAPVTVIGRASAIDAISDFTGFASEAQEEIRLKGRLGVYRGANLVVVKNYQDETGAPFLSENEVYVISGSAGLLVKYGAVRAWDWTDNPVRYVHSVGRMSAGVAITQPQLLRRITLA